MTHCRYLPAALIAFMLIGTALAADDPVALRAENFTVQPSSGPVTNVLVKNLLDGPYEGAIRLKLPEGWQANPTERNVLLKPGETRRVPFTLEDASDVEANSYPVEVVATGGGATVVRKQAVVAASAPYYKPKIDGKTRDWDDAIPVTFSCRGKKTVVRTYWNKGSFCLLVEVEEDKLIGYRRKPPASGFDAVQFAISPQGAVTGAKLADKSARYEFLIVDSGSMWSGDKCFQLARPGMSLSDTQEKQNLAPLKLDGARVAVKRRGGVTIYECAIPFAAMPEIKPTVGREIRFSVLVHDPDGTGVRDWGEATGLWPSRRNRLAWSSWNGVKWPKQASFDNKIEWGLCSSKH